MLRGFRVRCFRWNGKWRAVLSLALPRTLHLATSAQLLLAKGSQKTHQNVSGAKCGTPVAQMLHQMLYPKCLMINDVVPVVPFRPNTRGRDRLGHGFAFPKALRKTLGGIRTPNESVLQTVNVGGIPFEKSSGFETWMSILHSVPFVLLGFCAAFASQFLVKE